MKTNVLSVLFGGNKAFNSQTDETTRQPTLSIAEIAYPEGGFEVAGFCMNGNYRVLSRKTGQMVELGPRQLEEATFFAHFGMSYCVNNFCEIDPKTGKRIFKVEKLTKEIRQGCDEFGPAKLDMVRGPGIYLDGQELVVHYGNAVYDQHGEPVSTLPTQSRAYVSGPGLGFDRDTPCASVADVHLLESTFESFGFEQRWGAAASMGWFASSPLGAALPNSPCIILAAAKGSGKSAWANLQKALMGPQAILRDGVPTAPQVLHAIGEQSVTLICDEFEPLKRTKKQIDELTEVFNSGFTKGSDQGKFTRATGGKLRYFNPPTGVAMCGINLPELDDALESRAVRLSMVPLTRAGKQKSPLLNGLDNQEAKAMGARVRRLAISRWDVLRDTRSVVHQMLQDIGHGDRLADTYSPIIAGYVALKHTAVPSRAELNELLGHWELDKVKSDEHETPSDACLNVLLDRKFILHLEQDGVKVKTHVRIRDAVRLLVAQRSDKLARRPVETQLEMLGVRVLRDADTDTWSLAVASSQHHLGVRQLFQGTAWAKGGWKDTLLRLTGSSKGQARIAGDSIKVVFVKLPDSVVAPVIDDEDADEDTAPSAVVTRGEWLN